MDLVGRRGPFQKLLLMMRVAPLGPICALRLAACDGSVTVLGIIDVRGFCGGRCRRGFEYFYRHPTALSATVRSETDLITAEPSNSHGGSSDRNIAWRNENL